MKRHEAELYTGMTGADLIRLIQEAGVDPEDISLEFEAYGENYCLQWKEPESEEEFAIRRKEYEKKLRAYEQWKKDHAVQIEEEKKEREAKERRELEASLKVIEKQAQRLRERLGKA
jgi:hypothetical protein